MRLNTDEWDSLSRERQDHLLDRKRAAEASIDPEAAPVGILVRGAFKAQGTDDWKLKLAMLREAREEEDSERRRIAYNRPEIRAARSDAAKKAWADGKWATRKQAYCKRTDARVARARRLRSDGTVI